MAFLESFPSLDSKIEEEYKANNKVVGQKQSNMCAVELPRPNAFSCLCLSSKPAVSPPN